MISILLTSSNIQNICNLLSSLSLTVSQKDDVEVIICTTHDTDTSKFNKLFDNIICVQEKQINNHSYMLAYNNAKGDIFMICDESVTFESKGWDDIVRWGFKTNPDNIVLVFGRDGRNDISFSSCPFIHRKWIETIGYLGGGRDFSYPINAWLNDISIALNRRVFFNDIFIKYNKDISIPDFSEEREKQKLLEINLLKNNINNRFNMLDNTFMIPVRIDQEERAKNLKTIVKFLNKNFNTNIIIAEQSDRQIVPDIVLDEKFTYLHIKSDDYFNKAKLLNIMTRMSTTQYVTLQDADTLVKKYQYINAYNLLKNNYFVSPYNSRCIDISGDILNNIYNKLDIEDLNYNSGIPFDGDGYNIGGVLFFNKNKLIEVGMHNEIFKSWGWEDMEIHVRINKMGYSITRVDGNIFHLHHNVSKDSQNTNHINYENNLNECTKILKMSTNNIKEYISNWAWINPQT